MHRLSKFVVSGLLFLVNPLIVSAQAYSATGPVELLPDHIARRIQADAFENAADALVVENKISRGIIVGAKRWNIAEPVKVCFFGGSRALRQHIAAVAATWEQTGTGLRFDFGDRADPRFCTAAYSQIRVGYSQKGYWSLVGQDSIAYAPQTEQSLNLAMFDVNPPEEAEFRRVVLHEFGHAIGFQHEHQHPTQGCSSEFNWESVYNYLEGPPNYWSQETVDFNMRSRPYEDGDVTTEFDRRSIMLYSFPAEFYTGGTANRCFAPSNTSLSPGDIKTIKLVYPGTTSGTATPVTIEHASVMSDLDSGAKAAVRQRVALFSADSATQARIIGVPNAQYVDVDVYACSTRDADRRLLGQVVNVIAAQPAIGRLRQVETAYPGSLPSGSGLFVVADFNHPEVKDARRLALALSDAFNIPTRVAPNPSPVTRWYLSIAVCKSR